MFDHNIRTIKIRSKSEQAFDFWHNRYKPILDSVKMRIRDIPLSILIWAPRSPDIVKLYLYEIKHELEQLKVKTELLIGDVKSDLNESIRDMEKAGESFDYIFGVILSPSFKLEIVFSISSDITSKLFLFLDKSIEEAHRKDKKAFKIQNIYKRSLVIEYPNDFRNNEFNKLFKYAIDVLRCSIYMKEIFEKSKKPLKSSKTPFSLYQEYKTQIDTFWESGHNYFISFIRFLEMTNLENLNEHFKIDADELSYLESYFVQNGLITRANDQIQLTYRGEIYFSLFGIESLPILNKEKKEFQERWEGALTKTQNVHFKLSNIDKELKTIANDYFQLAKKELSFKKKFRYFITRFIFDWTTKYENIFLGNQHVQFIFEKWQQNIAFHKRGWRPDIREKIDFLEYVYDHFEKAYDNKYSEITDNYNNLVYNLSMLRPNSHVHVYILQSFNSRPIKKCVEEYLRISLITGNYKIFFSRFIPYHNMLKLHAYHGERTFLDTRQIDWKPVTYKLSFKFILPIGMKNIHTRQNNRSITIPIETDDNLEHKKQLEIKSLENDVNSKFPTKDYASKYSFDQDGHICYEEKEKNDIIEEFGSKRGALFQMTDELNLLKTNYCPSESSGLILRFTFLDPVAILIDGIKKQRQLTFSDIRYLIKILDLMENTPDSVPVKTLIDQTLHSSNSKSLKGSSQEMIREIERIRFEEESEESAWDYLKFQLIHGKHQPLLKTICFCLQAEGFDLLFSLYPMMKGKELKMDPSGNLEVDNSAKTINQLPFLESLKQELEDLLRNIFSKYIDISEATKRRESEPILAKMIVKYCLNTKADPTKFEIDLRRHLKEHYECHEKFLLECYGKSAVIANIHKIGEDIDTRLDMDVQGIIQLIDASRKRLYSPGIYHRLLCFIDPKSIEVQNGEFLYNGDIFREEGKFIDEAERRENKSNAEKDAKRNESEKAIKLCEYKLDEERRITETESEIHRSKLQRTLDKLKIDAVIALKNNDLSKYSILSLAQCQLEGGLKKLNEVIENNPNILLFVDKELHEIKQREKIKQIILDKLDAETIKALDPLVLQSLMSSNDEERIQKLQTQVYKEAYETSQQNIKEPRHRIIHEQVVSVSDPKNPHKPKR